ncbi:hypothetical protein C0Q70_15480 [Pomacea canaliculata]|uniref:Uncharacterized protein n=1 Tax=Pomacea canaliculata TaxID=400727 RepID=A0A2T7NUZ0_POMCA|nr:hypothetical protein C0Q70_15480 [Pomacea canaliculata]
MKLSFWGVRPYISVFKNDVGSVPIGYFAYYTIIIKTNPGDTIPISSISPPQRLDTGHRQQFANNTFDDDTIQVEVVISVPSTAVSGTQGSFAVLMSYAGTTYSPTVPSFNITSNTSIISKKSNNVTDFQLSVIPISATDNDTNVVAGQVKRFQVCAWTVPSATSALVFNLMAPTTSAVQQVEVTYFGLLSGGSNLPCYSGPCYDLPSLLMRKKAKESKKEEDEVNMNSIERREIHSDEEKRKKERVCADGTVRVLKDSGLSPGSKISMTASASLNGLEYVSRVLDLTVVGNETFVDIYRDNITIINGSIIDVNLTFSNPVKMQPGGVQTIPLIVSIPPYVTSLVTMDVRLEKTCRPA